MIFFPFIKNIVVVPCDVESNCHPNASCKLVAHEIRHACVCNPGFEGNGYECLEISNDTSCLLVSIS